MLLKKIDVYGQIAVIVFTVIYGLLVREYTFIMGYFVVGFWQIFSATVHYFKMRHMPLLKSRDSYLKLLLGVAIASIISIAAQVLFFFWLIILLFGTPLVAIWYSRISWKELDIWQARAWVHLK